MRFVVVIGCLALLSGCTPTPDQTCDKLQELSKTETGSDGKPFDFDRGKCMTKMDEMKSRDPDAYKCAAKMVKGMSKFDTAVLAVSICDKNAPKDKDKDTPSDKASSAPAASAAPADDGWKPYTSAEGKFTASFLGGSKQETHDDPNVKGVKWFDTKSEIGLYLVSYADFTTPAAAAAGMKQFLDIFKKNADEVTEDKEITFAGFKTQSVTAKTKTATMWMRAFVDGKRFYKVSCGNKNNPEKAEKFFSSFTLSK